MSETHVAVLVGSLRADSLNRKLAEKLRDEAPEGVTLEIVEGLEQLPFYNEEIDGDQVPEAAARIRAQVVHADRVLLVTPEYNGSLPSALKNAVDWVSRPRGTAAMAGRPVDALSGGELQRVWLASCLAQETGVLLLDEPTNHLDLRYQVEILDLVRDLADEHGTALGVVLHDLDQAASVADHVVLLQDGRIRSSGTPDEVLVGDVLSDVYGLPLETRHDPDTGLVRVQPITRRTRKKST